jgi:hypothetical protein
MERSVSRRIASPETADMCRSTQLRLAALAALSGLALLAGGAISAAAAPQGPVATAPSTTLVPAAEGRKFVPASRPVQARIAAAARSVLGNEAAMLERDLPVPGTKPVRVSQGESVTAANAALERHCLDPAPGVGRAVPDSRRSCCGHGARLWRRNVVFAREVVCVHRYAGIGAWDPRRGRRLIAPAQARARLIWGDRLSADFAWTSQNRLLAHRRASRQARAVCGWRRRSAAHPL